MKKKYVLMLLVCLSPVLMPQSLTIVKTDGSSTSFKIADIDSVAISTTSSAKIISAADGNCVSASSLAKIAVASGVYEDAEEGLKVFGNNNNTVQLVRVSQGAITNKTIYLRWKASSSQVSVGVDLFESTGNLDPVCNAFSISTNSGLVYADTWYYTRIQIAGGEVTTVTAKDNFDSNGGAVIVNSTVPISREVKTYSFKTTAGNTSYTILSEARVE